MSNFRGVLVERAAVAGIEIPDNQLAAQEKYFELLTRWNERINLTALPLEGVPLATIDRLFIEPLAAARHVPDKPIRWFDVGSGGGSPAIPLKIAHQELRLTMVESRGRKAAFLREVVRELELADAEVEERRFEGLFGGQISSVPADLVTIRAVKAEFHLLELCSKALRSGGRLLLFQTRREGSVHLPDSLTRVKTVELSPTAAFLDVLEAR